MPDDPGESRMHKCLVVAGVGMAIAAGPAFAQEPQDSYRFVMVPKVVHPWFDVVFTGAEDAAALIEQVTGATVEVEYRAPQSADVVEQNQIIERTIATRPDGIMIDPLDAACRRSSNWWSPASRIPPTRRCRTCRASGRS